MQKKFLRPSTVLIVVMCWMCNHASYGGFSEDSLLLDMQENPPHTIPVRFPEQEENRDAAPPPGEERGAGSYSITAISRMMTILFRMTTGR